MDLSYNEADLAIAIASEGLRPRLPGEDGGDGGGDDDVVRAVSELIRACWSQARSIHWSPYDPVGVVNVDPYGLSIPACLSAHPSRSIPALGAFQLQLTPLNSTPTFACMERPSGSRRAPEVSRRRAHPGRHRGGVQRRARRAGERAVGAGLARAVGGARRRRRRRRRGETASHTTPFAWCTPFLEDFSRRHSSPALPFQRLTGKTFD